MNNIGRVFMDEAMEYCHDFEAPARKAKREIAQMWADYAKRQMEIADFNRMICDALWADKHDKEEDELMLNRINAAKEITAYFGDALHINKEETPQFDFTIPAPAEKKKAHRRKTYFRNKAKNAQKLRSIYVRSKESETTEATRKSDRSATDFKFYGRDLEELILKGKRLSEIGGVPKRYKNYSKATRNDPDAVMYGNGYKKSCNWKVNR